MRDHRTKAALRRGLVALAVAAVAPLAVAVAQDRAVQIELRTGEQLEGELVGYGEHAFKVRTAAGVRELAEGDVARLVFRPAGEPASVTSACPACFAYGTGERCEKDGTPLVHSGLVLFHEALASLARAKAPLSWENPFADLAAKDGSVDLAALERLVRDYELAARRHPFGPYAEGFPLVPPPVSLRQKPSLEQQRIVQLVRKIAAMQEVYRHTTDRYASLGVVADVDLKLAFEKLSDAYVFRSDAGKRLDSKTFYVAAIPAAGARRGPGDLSYFVNQDGTVWAGNEFVVDEVDCRVPPGLVPVEDEFEKGRRAREGAAPRPAATAPQPAPSAEPAKPEAFSLESLIPAASDLPLGTKLYPVRPRGPEATEAEQIQAANKVKDARAKGDPEETQSAIEAAAVVAGRKESLVVPGDETGGNGFGVTYHLYESPEKAKRSLAVLRRTWAAEGTIDTYLAGPVVAVLEYQHLHPATVVGLRRAVVRSLERAALRIDDRLEPKVELGIDSSSFRAPVARIPGVLEVATKGYSYLVDGGVHKTQDVLFTLARGRATLEVWVVGSEGHESVPAGEPLAVWIAQRHAVALFVEGEVGPETTATLELWVDWVLASSRGGHGARRLVPPNRTEANATATKALEEKLAASSWTAHLAQQPLGVALRAWSKATGVPIALAPEVEADERPLDVDVTDCSWKGLRTLVGASDAAVELRGGVVAVVPRQP